MLKVVHPFTLKVTVIKVAFQLEGSASVTTSTLEEVVHGIPQSNNLHNNPNKLIQREIHRLMMLCWLQQKCYLQITTDS